jgi:hypothetical protein
MFHGHVLFIRSSVALVLAISACGGGDLSLPSDSGSVHLQLVHGDEQSGPTGERLPDSLVVRLVDQDGQGIAGETVTWVVSDGGGSVTPRAGTTDSAGFAVARWTLGPAAGPNTLDALVSRVGLVTFTAMGTEDAEPPGEVDRLVYLVPPEDVDVGDRFSVEVALVDASGEVVPLSGIMIYLGLFEEGQDTPVNSRLLGSRFHETVDGVAVFDGLSITDEGRYRLRALTDDLPELGPHGPEPFLFSDPFRVE